MTFFRGLKPKKEDLARTPNGVMSKKRNSSKSSYLQSQRRVRDDTDTHLNENDSSPSSDHRKRKHVKHLRSITANILKEQISADTSLKNRNIFEIHRPNDKNTTTRGNNNNNYDFAKLEPWVESSPSTDVQQSGSSDLMTEERTTSTICSAFEMLSFDHLCNGTKTLREDGILDVRRGCLVGGNLKVLGRASDFPREINFERGNSCSRGHGNLREELVINRRRKSKILQKLLHLKPLSRAERSTKVTKVKVYLPLIHRTLSTGT